MIAKVDLDNNAQIEFPAFALLMAHIMNDADCQEEVPKRKVVNYETQTRKRKANDLRYCKACMQFIMDQRVKRAHLADCPHRKRHPLRRCQCLECRLNRGLE